MDTILSTAPSAMALSTPGGDQTIYSRRHEDGMVDNASMYVLPDDCKPFQCGLCCVSFDLNTELIVHIQAHRLTRPYQCGYCKVSYESNPDLLAHVMSHNLCAPGHSISVVQSHAAVSLHQHREDNDQRGALMTQSRQSAESQAGAETLTLKDGSPSSDSEDTFEDEKPDIDDESADDKDSPTHHWRKNEGSYTLMPTSLKMRLKGRLGTKRGSFAVEGKNSEILGSSEDPNHMAVVQKEESSESHVDGSWVGPEKKKRVPAKTNQENRQLLRKMQQKKKINPVRTRRKRCPRRIAQAKYSESPTEISDMIYQCGDCDALFKAPSMLRRHWESCHKACRICGEGFPNPPLLEDHLKAAHGVDSSKEPYRPFLCGLCGTSFQVAKYVLHHIRKLHKERKDLNDSLLSEESKKMFSCSVCPEKFVKQKQLLDHLRGVHKGHRHFRCAVCNQTFKDLSHMKRHHTTTHLHIEWRPYKCEECNERFELYQNLKSHCEAFHCQGSARPNQCSICGLSFKLEEALTRHTEACRILAESKKQSEPIEEHVPVGVTEDVTNNVQEGKQTKKRGKTKVVCHICGMLVRSLNTHISSQHLDVRPYKCTLCDKALKTRWALENHLRVHNNEKPFTCEVCGRSFLKMKTLKYHRNTHTNARPYLCEMCNRGFNSHSGLMVHRRRHTGDRRHTCNVCGMKFFASSNLQRHALTHTDLRPWSCEECGKTYRARSSLRYHMSHSHS